MRELENTGGKFKSPAGAPASERRRTRASVSP